MIWDAIVVGGGPAGTSVAIWLARAGWQVCLLERARSGRDKPCGEFLTRQAQILLAELGAWEDACEAGAWAIAAAVLVAPNGAELRHCRADGGPTGYALRRAHLDSILLNTARQAGVSVEEGWTVRKLEEEGKKPITSVSGTNASGEAETLAARLVIGADGSHSLVARQLGIVRAIPRLQRLGIVSHWQNVFGPADTIEMRANGSIVCGLGSLSDGVNLTLDVPTEFAPQISKRTIDFVRETVAAHFPDLAARLEDAHCEPTVRTIGCFGHVCRPPVAAGMLLVGDAATFIDPFTGEGVYFALRGAQLAAEVADRALRRGDTALPALMPYARARSELARRYLLCDLIQAVVRQPTLYSAFVRRVRRVPALADRLFAVLSDTRPPTDTLHPAFLWKLLSPEW